MKALIVRLSSIGDVVHTLPAAGALRRHGYQVGWVVEPAARELLEGNPCVQWVLAAPRARLAEIRSLWRGLRTLRRERYDVALDLQGLWKSAGWARLSNAPRVVGFAGRWRREPASALLLGERSALADGISHVIDKNLALLRALSIDAVGSREFVFPDASRPAAQVQRSLATLGVDDFAILNPGGGWASKLWPAERFGRLAQGLQARGLPALVTWGPGEEGLADQVVAASSGAARRCFATSLLDFLELARRARIVIAADTGPLHLACAVGAPVIGLFGPTDPARNGPFAPSDRVVSRVPPCFPCYRRRCRRHAGVMDSIKPAQVLQAVERRLAAAPRARGGQAS